MALKLENIYELLKISLYRVPLGNADGYGRMQSGVLYENDAKAWGNGIRSGCSRSWFAAFGDAMGGEHFNV